MVETLTERTAGSFVKINCSGCHRELKIPTKVYKRIEKARMSRGENPPPILQGGPNDLFVYEYGIYCTKPCFNFYNEDWLKK